MNKIMTYIGLNKPVMYCVIGMLVLSALMGSFKAKTSTQIVRTPQDNWASYNTQTRTPNYRMTAINIKASGLLPLTPEQIRALENTGDPLMAAPKEKPPFPQIKSVFNADGTLHVMLMLADNSLVAAKTGDTIDLGWTIESIDLSNVIAIFDGKEHEFPVIEYSRGQEDENE